MTLAGTRPPTVDEWDKYELHHRARLATKPGLTGMWQVSGRSNIMWQLEVLYNTLGDVEEKNEFAYRDGVQKLIYQLEVYDQVWIERNLTKVIGNGEKIHSEQGRELAQKMIEYLESEEGSAELFPYEIIDELKEEYGV